MFHDFEEFQVQTQSEPEVLIHGIKSRQSSSHLPALLLLHGFPQNYRIWHRVAPRLTSKYNVIAMDIRGYGASSKPLDVSAYAKSAMAKDCVEVMKHLGHDSFFVCAHDRGARVAHKLCVDYPRVVRKAVFLDICPTLAMYTKTDFEFSKSYFHWFFLIQKEPLPENAISANPRHFAENFMGGRQGAGTSIFDPACFESYIQGLGDPATIHAMCQDYRASSTLDLEEAESDLKKGNVIRSPLLVLWGKHGIIEKCFKAVEEWKAVSAQGVEVSGYSVDSGHYIPEQSPDKVVEAVEDFLT